MSALVLTIDDNSLVKRSVRRRFRGRAVSTDSTQEGVEIARRLQPRVVLLDSHRMQVIPSIRAVAPKADFIVCTDDVNDIEVRRAEHLRADSYLEKLDIDGIIYEIAAIFAGL